MKVEVPGDVHSTLLKYKKIGDPFYSTNSEKCRWIESKTWVYKTQFNYDRKFDKNEIVEINFNGIDTFGTVYLNIEMLGKHENMFTPISFDISNKIKHGLNTLIVKIDSTIEVTNKKDYTVKCGFHTARTESGLENLI